MVFVVVVITFISGVIFAPLSQRSCIYWPYRDTSGCYRSCLVYLFGQVRTLAEVLQQGLVSAKVRAGGGGGGGWVGI